MPNRQELMRVALATRFASARIELSNESHRHVGHGGDDGSGETHYRLTIYHPELSNLSRVAAQREINAVLAPFFATGLHAVEMHILQV